MNIPSGPDAVRTGWIIIAISAVLLAIALVVVARLRWTQTRPMKACVVLSVFAHLLLLAVFYFSRVFDVPFIPGGDSSIVVQLTFDDQPIAQQESSEAEVVAAPPEAVTEDAVDSADVDELPSADLDIVDKVDDLNVAERDQSPPDAIDPTPSEPARIEDALSDVDSDSDPLSMLDPPSAAPPIEALTVPDGDQLDPKPQPLLPADDLVVEDSQESAQETEPLPLPPSELISDSDESATSPPADDNPWQVAQRPQVPRRYRDRVDRPAAEELERRGGNPHTEAAVGAALSWLATHQADDGRWKAATHGAGRGGWIEGQHRGTTGLRADTGITGLALLSFLGAGETQRRGSHRETVEAGIQFLIDHQDSQGCLADRASIYARMYCHGIATLAICEALAMTADDRLRLPAQRAINYTIHSQHPQTGGWRYRPGDIGDTSQFGWQLMALTAAKEADLDVPRLMDSRLRRFLRSVQSGHRGGLASYRPGHSISRSMTAEAMACRMLLGDRMLDQNTESVAYIMGELPGQGQTNFYYWYYATLGLSQVRDEGLRQSWVQWNRSLQKQLLTSQRRRGTQSGSWDPNCVWGAVGGRVYSTSLAVLCLESYYRYAPTSSQPVVADQNGSPWSRH